MADEERYTLEEADLQRLAALSGMSSAAGTVHIEVLYRDRWVRFDMTGMETLFASPNVLFARYFDRALADLGLDRSAAVHEDAVTVSSSQPVLKET